MEGGRRVSSSAGTSGAPLFTIVTAAYNSAATIERTLEGTAGQRCSSFEHIVMDGGSSDGTVRILERYGDHIEYWRSEPDSGIYDAWNKAIGLARGQWIAFVGADDVYYPDALENYAQFVDRQGAALQYLSAQVDLMRDGRGVRILGRAWKWPEFSRYMTVAHVGSMHHRTLFDQYGLFDPRYKICGDYELLLRPRGALRAGFMPIRTAKMSYGGVSNANPRRALLEAQRAKHISGGRAGWLCAIEFQRAQAMALVRKLVK